MNPEYDKHQGKRDQLFNEVNGISKGANYIPKLIPVDKTIYIKTDEEKAELKTRKYNIRNAIILKGLDPKKHLNVPI